MSRLAGSKPVVASLGSVAASGGYYVAVAADSVIADPGTLTGSIGVIFAYPTAKALMDKLGVTLQVYKSGELKDMGSYAREPTEEEGEVFDALIADVYDQFVSAVADGRRMERDRVIALADGRVYTGRQAVEIGLVDRLGDLHEAINVAAELGGLSEDPSVVRKAKPRFPLLDLLDTVLGFGSPGHLGAPPGVPPPLSPGCSASETPCGATPPAPSLGPPRLNLPACCGRVRAGSLLATGRLQGGLEVSRTVPCTLPPAAPRWLKTPSHVIGSRKAIGVALSGWPSVGRLAPPSPGSHRSGSGRLRSGAVFAGPWSYQSGEFGSPARGAFPWGRELPALLGVSGADGRSPAHPPATRHVGGAEE